MLVIGITGNIGSGKSLAIDYLSKKYNVYRMDEKAKEIMLLDTQIQTDIRKAFGSESFNDEGQINSDFIASKVFGKNNSKNLNKLNSIVHPKVIDNMMEFVEEQIKKDTDIIFIESALLFEAGIDDGFDYVINIFAEKEICVERIMRRNNLNEIQAEERLESQISPEQKRQLADFTINNNKSKEEFFIALDTIIDIVQFLPEKEFN